MRYLTMAVMATVLVWSAMTAQAKHIPPYQVHMPGWYEEVRDAGPGELKFRCRPPYDHHCATLVVQPGPNATPLTSSLGFTNSPSALWVPSLQRGYINMTYNGATSNPAGTSATYHLSETSNTATVSSFDAIRAWLESTD